MFVCVGRSEEVGPKPSIRWFDHLGRPVRTVCTANGSTADGGRLFGPFVFLRSAFEHLCSKRRGTNRSQHILCCVMDQSHAYHQREYGSHEPYPFPFFGLTWLGHGPCGRFWERATGMVNLKFDGRRVFQGQGLQLSIVPIGLQPSQVRWLDPRIPPQPPCQEVGQEPQGVTALQYVCIVCVLFVGGSGGSKLISPSASGHIGWNDASRRPTCRNDKTCGVFRVWSKVEGSLPQSAQRCVRAPIHT